MILMLHQKLLTFSIIFISNVIVYCYIAIYYSMLLYNNV